METQVAPIDEHVIIESRLISLNSKFATEYLNGTSKSSVSFDFNAIARKDSRVLYHTIAIQSAEIPSSFYNINASNNITNITKKFQHGPVGAGDCIACHNAHASNTEKLLIAEMAGGEVCFQCHADRRDSFNLKEVHKPVKEDCGKCHDPHSSNHKMQLHKEQNVLCKECHQKTSPALFKEIAGAKFKHAPVDEGRCADCHRPHSSNYKPLLDDTMEKLCFQCHVELGDEVADSKYRHGPVKTGDCTACHNKIHGSTYAKLLGRAFPMNFYDSYTPTKYDLCFGCHNKDIAKKKITKELTSFRDGEYNLHFLHVNRKKGRTCTSCHGAHASTQAKHVREEVPFGGWAYPIQFTKTKEGGTCVVGCHAPKTYNRVKPLMKLGNK